MASVLVAATSKVPFIRRADDGVIQTEPFLAVCRLVLPVVDKLGTAFMLVKTDVNGNIQRLADRVGQNQQRYSQLYTIVLDEVVKNTHTEASSCTKGLLWLKRAMEFMVALLQRVHDDGDAPLTQIVSEVYTNTLYKYHGFFASSAFSLAFKFVPSHAQFLSSLGDSQALMQEMQDFIDAFSPILADVQAFMVANNLDDPTKV